MSKDLSNKQEPEYSSVGTRAGGSVFFNSKHCSISEKSYNSTTAPCDSTLLINNNTTNNDIVSTSSVSNGFCEMQNISNHKKLYKSSMPYEPQKIQSIALNNPKLGGTNPHTNVNNSTYTARNQIRNHSNPQTSTTMSLDERVLSFTRVQKLDLIHDDWFGLAPLASPESLSELSSISSRSGFSLNLIDSNLVHTPIVMRRAPKITNNLSKCADDWRLVDNYSKMEKFILKIPKVPLISDDTESTTRKLYDNNNEIIFQGKNDNFDQYDNGFNHTTMSIGENKIKNKFVNFETDNDNMYEEDECATTSQMTQIQTPIIKHNLGKIINNKDNVNDNILRNNQLNDFNIKCLPAKNVNFSNSEPRIIVDKCTGFLSSRTSPQSFSRVQQPITSSSSSSSSSSVSISQTKQNCRIGQFKVNSSDRNRSLNQPEVYRINNSASGILESHFPVFEDIPFLKSMSGDNQNNKNESLPLLHKLDNKSKNIPTSSSSSSYYPRKKNYVYPIKQPITTITSNLTSTSPTAQHSSKNESNV